MFKIRTTEPQPQISGSYKKKEFIYVLFRAETFLKQTAGDERALQESQNLTMFLATHDIITSKLKSSLEEIDG